MELRATKDGTVSWACFAAYRQAISTHHDDRVALLWTQEHGKDAGQPQTR